MTTASYHLPLKAPTPLPAAGKVTTVTFKVWKNTLIAHLEQDINLHFFMPDGLYSNWQARENGPYLLNLNNNDPERLILQEKRTAGTLTAAEFTARTDDLLCKRNSHLSKFITHIATLCHYTEHDDVTSLALTGSSPTCRNIKVSKLKALIFLRLLIISTKRGFLTRRFTNNTGLLLLTICVKPEMLSFLKTIKPLLKMSS